MGQLSKAVSLNVLIDELKRGIVQITKKPNVSQFNPGNRRFVFFDYLITRSALANTFGGIVRPIFLAAFRLMMNSNFFGCSTGRSAGFVP
jgi:hypothetical protein